MTKCHACGLEEPSQLRCGVCGKTYCSEHLLRQNHNCFVDPKSIRDDQYAGKTYGSGAARETNPPRADYYDADQFEHRHQYSAKRAQPTWKTISGSSTYVIIIICAVFQMIELPELWDIRLFIIFGNLWYCAQALNLFFTALGQ